MRRSNGCRTPQAADVAYASTALRKGAQLLKYCRRGKPHACHVQLAPDECEIQWVSAAGKPKTVRLAAVKDVVSGQTTALFRCVHSPAALRRCALVVASRWWGLDKRNGHCSHAVHV
jgi:hypothetical protein